MPADIQDLMRAELAREIHARARSRPTVPRGKGARPIRMGPSWVVACFAAETPRFLVRGAAGWTVALTPDRAHRFADQASAEAALADFRRRHAGATFHAGDSWCVKEMQLTASFR